MIVDLGTVLADWLGQAAVLRARGHGGQADTIEQVVATVKASARPYLDWLSEEEALLRSGRSVEFLRARFPAWEREGMARMVGRHRSYRRCIVPARANLDAARGAARAAAKESAA